MKKEWMTLLIAAGLVMAPLGVLAEDASRELKWICSNCGNEAAGNICSNCGFAFRSNFGFAFVDEEMSEAKLERSRQYAKRRTPFGYTVNTTLITWDNNGNKDHLPEGSYVEIIDDVYQGNTHLYKVSYEGVTGLVRADNISIKGEIVELITESRDFQPANGIVNKLSIMKVENGENVSIPEGAEVTVIDDIILDGNYCYYVSYQGTEGLVFADNISVQANNAYADDAAVSDTIETTSSEE